MAVLGSFRDEVDVKKAISMLTDHCKTGSVYLMCKKPLSEDVLGGALLDYDHVYVKENLLQSYPLLKLKILYKKFKFLLLPAIMTLSAFLSLIQFSSAASAALLTAVIGLSAFSFALSMQQLKKPQHTYEHIQKRQPIVVVDGVKDKRVLHIMQSHNVADIIVA
tara:strand:+ start:21386 stop:21877 length:492 start_codon:yes stop_codon:yes gene_type:complete